MREEGEKKVYKGSILLPFSSSFHANEKKENVYFGMRRYTKANAGGDIKEPSFIIAGKCKPRRKCNNEKRNAGKTKIRSRHEVREICFKITQNLPNMELTCVENVKSNREHGNLLRILCIFGFKLLSFTFLITKCRTKCRRYKKINIGILNNMNEERKKEIEKEKRIAEKGRLKEKGAKRRGRWKAK